MSQRWISIETYLLRLVRFIIAQTYLSFCKKLSDWIYLQDLTNSLGDGCKWLIAEKDAVVGTWYDNQERTVLQSSLTNKTHMVKWYRKEGMDEMWISLVDYDSATYLHEMLYGQNNNGDFKNMMDERNGANVYIRYSGQNTSDIFGIVQ